jgi:hypothetical protein
MYTKEEWEKVMYLTSLTRSISEKERGPYQEKKHVA